MTKKNAVITGKKTWPLLYKPTATGKVQVWRIWVEPGPGHVGVIHIRHGQQGGKMQTQTETVAAGKNLGRKNETTPFEQAVLEAAARWAKQKDRKGYGLTVEEGAAAKAALPMLAHDYPEHVAKVDWATAYCQPKLDGHRGLATRRDDGTVVLLSRQRTEIAGLPHVVAALEAVMAPGETFDGELYAHGMSLQKIASATRRKKGAADHAEQVRYHVYDMVADARFEDRQARVARALAGRPEGLELVPTVVVRSRDELAVCESEFLAAGYEGAILRHGTQGYQPGKRCDTLLKVKTFIDREFLVVDAKEMTDTSTHRGQCRFICETDQGEPFGVVAPGSHEEKRAYWDDHARYIGRRLTVKFEKMSASRSPVPLKPVAKGFFCDDEKG